MSMAAARVAADVAALYPIDHPLAAIARRRLAEEASMTEPLTGPADTNDPNVRVSTVMPPKPATAAELKTGTRPGAVEVDPIAAAERAGGRVDEYDLTAPDGQVVHVRKDLDSGRVDYTNDDGSPRGAAVVGEDSYVTNLEAGQ